MVVCFIFPPWELRIAGLSLQRGLYFRAVARDDPGDVLGREARTAVAESYRSAVRESDRHARTVVTVVAVAEGLGFGDAVDFHAFFTMRCRYCLSMVHFSVDSAI